MKRIIEKIKAIGIELILINPRIFDWYEKYKSKKRFIKEISFLNDTISCLEEPIKIIQIGANDGLRSDPVRRLIIEHKCNAVFIEADPVCFNSLVINYEYLQKGNLQFENCAVVPNNNESLMFYSLSRDFRKKISRTKQIKLTRKASTNKDFIIKYLTKIGIKDAESKVCQQSVPTRTLSDLFRSYYTPDILVVDTEGLDWYLMDSLDLAEFLPKAILFESSFKTIESIETSVLKKFSENGYDIFEFTYNIGCRLRK